MKKKICDPFVEHPRCRVALVERGLRGAPTYCYYDYIKARVVELPCEMQ